MMDGFTFRKFFVAQDRCAMKVGTDGVLLGAWAEGGRHVLDVGTGTGLIALMMAQRFPEAEVIGIDLDASACEQANANVDRSPWTDRVKIIPKSLQEFTLAVRNDAEAQFDAIVSNPPFFTNGLKSPDCLRSMARHTDTLPFPDLLRCCYSLLSREGVLSVIVPSEVVDFFIGEAYVSGFKLLRKCAVKTVPRKLPKRFLLSFSKHRVGIMEESVEVICNADGSWSGWYRDLTDEFYVNLPPTSSASSVPVCSTPPPSCLGS